MKYNFDQVNNRYGTFCTQWDFVQDRFGAADIIPFTISDSDFKTFPGIIDVLHTRVEHGIYGYSRWNNPEFITAIEHWFRQQWDETLKGSDIVYGPTVMYMIKTVLQLVQQERKKRGVIINNPLYDGFRRLLAGLDCDVAIWTIDADGSLDFSKFEQLCKHPDNTVFLLCNPQNPTGKVFSFEELQSILAICRAHDVFVISDEIHMDFVYAPKRHVPITQVAASCGMSNHVALITSASKTFNTAALQCAYMIVPNEKIRLAYLTQLRDVDCLSSVSIMGMLATIEAYNNGSEWLAQMKKYLLETFIWIEDYIESNDLPLHFLRPEASYFAWIDMSSVGLTEMEIQQQLIEQGVAIMPGSYYLETSGNFLRLNIAAPRSKVVQAIEALRVVCANQKK